MSRELLCYQQKNAFTVLVSTAHLPFSMTPRTSSRHELNLNEDNVSDDELSVTRNFKENVNV